MRVAADTTDLQGQQIAVSPRREGGRKSDEERGGGRERECMKRERERDKNTMIAHRR
jgi:hypothetical protein